MTVSCGPTSDQTASREFVVRGWGLFVPGAGNTEAWLTADGETETTAPSGSFIQPRQRRRASGLTRAMADAYAEALLATGLAPEQVGAVFGSALGEASTMIGLLGQMWADEPLSPMKFVTSVHNTAAGMISISGKNVGFTTSLGADYDTPAMALMDALGWAAAHEQTVIVCCGDEPSPTNLVPNGQDWELLAAAVAIVPAPPGSSADDVSGPRVRLVNVSGDEAGKEAGLPHAIARNPCAGMLGLVDALAREKKGIVSLDNGRGQGYAAELL